MKNIFKIVLFLSIVIAATACSNDDEPKIVEQPLEVTYANVAGTWQLTNWNGKPLVDGLYCYIELNRKEQTFVIYDNMNSMFAHKLTGSFTLAKDENDESIDIISGAYDYDGGSWSNSYQLQVFAQRMTWTVLTDHTDVSLYERCPAIPDNVLNGVSRTYKMSEIKKFL